MNSPNIPTVSAPPVDMTQIDLPSGSIEYTTLGPAESAHPPVVFVHGVLIDHRLWLESATRLAAAGHRCYLPLLPLGAHHLPWGPEFDRSPRGASRIVREFVDELELDDATIVCNDTGGAITQYALDDDPTFAGRVLFTNCDAFDLFPPQPFRLMFWLLGHRALIRPVFGGPIRVRALRHSPLGVGLLTHNRDADFTGSVFEQARTDDRIADDLATFVRAGDPAELAEITPRLSRLPIPVSFVWGVDDRCFTLAHGRRLAAIFDDAPFTEVRGARTFVGLDQPQAVVDAVETFS